MPHAPQHAAPLNLAAYATWLAVATEPALRLWAAGWPPSPTLVAGASGLVAVLLLFVAREASRSVPRQQVLIVAQLPAALLAFAAFGDGMQPILFILIAAQAAKVFDTRRLIALLVLANALLLVLMLREWSLLRALVGGLSYLGFQCFAAITVRAMAEAEAARDAAQRINAELLATRVLLAEGVRAEERLHLSRELHDVAGHKLTALKLHLARCAGEDDREAIGHSRALADELLADVRGVVGALRAHEGVALQTAIAALVRGLPGPRITLDLAGDARPANLDRAQALLRTAQEGVTNALRHAEASAIGIRLWSEQGELHLVVEDDGRGPGRAGDGNGLRGLAERLQSAGGRLHFGARAPRGSQLHATVPV